MTRGKGGNLGAQLSRSTGASKGEGLTPSLYIFRPLPPSEKERGLGGEASQNDQKRSLVFHAQRVTHVRVLQGRVYAAGGFRASSPCSFSERGLGGEAPARTTRRISPRKTNPPHQNGRVLLQDELTAFRRRQGFSRNCRAAVCTMLIDILIIVRVIVMMKLKITRKIKRHFCEKK